MMNSKIGLLKTSIIKNKSAKLFCKKMSSKICHNSNSQKMYSNFTATKSTKFSSENDFSNNTIQSSMYRLSKNNENPLSIELDNFHKQFILNRNHNMTINYLTDFNSYNKNNKKVVNLKKLPLSQTVYSSFSESSSGKIPLIKSVSSKIQKNNITYSFNSQNSRNEQNIFNNFERNSVSNTMKIFQNNELKSKIFNLENIQNKDNSNLNETLNIFKRNHIIKSKKHLNSFLVISQHKDKNKNDENKIENNFNKKEEKIKIY